MSPSAITTTQNCDLRDEIKPAAVIRAHDNLRILNNQFIQGETTIYGKLMRLGGAASDATLQIKLDNEVTLTCECHERFASRLAREDKLYRVVGLSGHAWWHPTTNELVRFQATDLLPYQEIDIVTAIDNLREASHGVFDDVDVQDYLEKLRGA